VVVWEDEGAVKSCVYSPSGTEITCARTKPKKDESDQAFAERTAKDFHSQAFTLAFSLSQKDLNSLDGRISGASQEDREKMNELLKDLAGGGGADKEKDKDKDPGKTDDKGKPKEPEPPPKP